MQLNAEQQKAVDKIEGSLLILAGAGSGKTTILVHRIANMIQNGINPENIMAVAFTNKAANEMKERVSKHIGEKNSKKIWISTFHRFCLQILRQEANLLKIVNKDFKTPGGFEQKQILKELLESNFSPEIQEDELFKPTALLRFFSLLKSELVGPKALYQRDFSPVYIDDKKVNELIDTEGYVGDKFKTLATLYALYQKELVNKNYVDLDDVLFYTCQLFLRYKTLLDKYQEQYQYILIDEYQDTNRVQYILIKLLASKYKNIAAVGDDSQSIYAFRGSDIRNILNFEREYPDSLIVKLEENYRSTKTILEAANQMISKNREKKEKNLYTSNEEGEKIALFECDMNTDEAEFVANKIEELVSGNYRYQDIAVFYRNNSDSSSLERILKNKNIPFKLSKDGGFFEQPEIIDIQKYLSFIANPKDVSSFARIINTPKRGIGKTSVEKIIAAANGGNLLSVCEHPEKLDGINKNTKAGLESFVKQMNTLLFLKDAVKISELINEVINVCEYEKSFEGMEESNIRTKKRNLSRLITEAEELQRKKYLSLFEFVGEITKRDVEIDPDDEEWNEVTLSTVHSAKGLEFPVVFIIGMREGSFPSQYALSNRAIEEERRLCYVAFTRAKEKLMLTYPKKRIEKGTKDENGVKSEDETVDNEISRFVNEFDHELLEKFKA
jgi:DNA helicase-2/ATP-dependent DNA helicase PcrA